MIVSRRGLLGFLAAPAIVSVANIMPVRSIERLLRVPPLFFDIDQPDMAGQTMTFSTFIKTDASLDSISGPGREISRSAHAVGGGWTRFTRTFILGEDGKGRVAIAAGPKPQVFGGLLETRPDIQTNWELDGGFGLLVQDGEQYIAEQAETPAGPGLVMKRTT